MNAWSGCRPANPGFRCQPSLIECASLNSIRRVITRHLPGRASRRPLLDRFQFGKLFLCASLSHSTNPTMQVLPTLGEERVVVVAPVVGKGPTMVFPLPALIEERDFGEDALSEIDSVSEVLG